MRSITHRTCRRCGITVDLHSDYAVLKDWRAQRRTSTNTAHSGALRPHVASIIGHVYTYEGSRMHSQ
jgi:hypothetical protein